MLRILVIIVLAVGNIFLSCSKSHMFLTKTGLTSKELVTNYKNVLLLDSQDLQNFVDKIEPIHDNTSFKGTGFISSQVFIDESGQVESVFLLSSLNEALDELAMKSLLKSSFKSIQEENTSIKYSCLVDYFFYFGKFEYSLVNGMPSDAILEKQVVSFYKLSKKTEVRKRVTPAYPPGAVQSDVQGEVVIGVVVDESGKVESTYVLKQNDFFLLGPAIKAAKQFEFYPGELDGKPVKSFMSIPFRYVLEEE